MTRSKFITRLVKPALFVGMLLPAAVLVQDALTGGLSANPIEDITHRTGRWGLTFLVATLAVTPLRRIPGWSPLIKVRRMVGLMAFSYLLLHFMTYVGLDQFFSIPDMIDDIAKRPYITVGFTSFLLLVPLALTSTNGMIRRLGGQRWVRLHRLIYVAAAGGVVHFLWLVKADTRDPTIYGLVLVALMAARLWAIRSRHASSRAPIQ